MKEEGQRRRVDRSQVGCSTERQASLPCIAFLLLVSLGFSISLLWGNAFQRSTSKLMLYIVQRQNGIILFTKARRTRVIRMVIIIKLYGILATVPIIRSKRVWNRSRGRNGSLRSGRVWHSKVLHRRGGCKSGAYYRIESDDRVVSCRVACTEASINKRILSPKPTLSMVGGSFSSEPPKRTTRYQC